MCFTCGACILLMSCISQQRTPWQGLLHASLRKTYFYKLGVITSFLCWVVNPNKGIKLSFLTILYSNIHYENHSS